MYQSSNKTIAVEGFVSSPVFASQSFWRGGGDGGGLSRRQVLNWLPPTVATRDPQCGTTEIDTRARSHTSSHIQHACCSRFQSFPDQYIIMLEKSDRMCMIGNKRAKESIV